VIPLRVGHVKLGWNKVSLRYFTPYNNNRVGLHSFIDQQDKKQYLYSQFEAYHCFRVFPCFDQPNLKAKMTLSLTIPDDWIAVGNEKEIRYDHAAKDGKRVLEKFGTTWFLDFYEDQSKVAAYAFDKTPKISTYLYALCAGPYRVFEDYDPMYVPQRVYVRESLVENLRYELIMGITKTTLDLYQKTYGHRYPFSKVDHVMCPDYKFGAMENVGCITYSDGIMCSSKTMSIP
jgi:aminopeptidase N